MEKYENPGGEGGGARGCHVRMQTPPSSGFMDLTPVLSLHLKSICELILVDFDVDISWFCLHEIHAVFW